MGIDDIIEKAVLYKVEQFFENGHIPQGLCRAIDHLVEKAVGNALGNVAKAKSSSRMPSSSGPTTGRATPRTSRPTEKDDENDELCVHEIIWINDKNNKSGVFHHASCRHVNDTTSSYTKCNKCINQCLKCWSKK